MKEMNPPGQSSIEALHTVTLHIYTLNPTYNEKKYAEILLHYRQLFIKDNVFIGERSIFGAEVFLCFRRFFIKSDFFIGGAECIYRERKEMNPPGQLSIEALHTITLYIDIYIYNVTSVMVCQFLQYLSKYALLSTSCFTTRNEQRILDMERLMTTQENFYIRKTFYPRG